MFHAELWAWPRLSLLGDFIKHAFMPVKFLSSLAAIWSALQGERSCCGWLKEMSWKYRNLSDKTNESDVQEKTSISVLGYLVYSFLLQCFFLSFSSRSFWFCPTVCWDLTLFSRAVLNTSAGIFNWTEGFCNMNVNLVSVMEILETNCVL